MDTKGLKKIMKPTMRKSKSVYLKEYIEDSESVTIKYYFRGQKESNLTIPTAVWKQLRFEVTDENKVMITNLGELKVKTNENNWSRLILEEEVEGEDE